MALKRRHLSILSILLLLVFSSCDKSPSSSEPEEPPFPSSVDITSPSSSTTYWDDEAVPCMTNQPDYVEETTWLVNGESMACTDGELADNLPVGEHTITIRITAEGESLESEVQITVKEGFTVSLENPEADSEFFVGDEVACAATVTPEQYQGSLAVTAGGSDCTNGSIQLQSAGETTFTATVSVDGRTEIGEAVVAVFPAVAGKLYPLTDRGVANNKAGYTVTLETPGQSYQVSTDGDGNFRFSEVTPQIYQQDELILHVAETADFYGARAEFATYTPWTPDDDGIPITAGEQLREITSADSLGFVLAPRRWQIRCGPLSGESTTIKLPEAFKRHNPDDPNSSFYKLRKTFQVYRYMSTRPDYRPLPTAFNEAEGTESIIAADSTAFWQETDEVFEPRLCRGDLFSLATLEEVPGTQDGVHVWAIGASDGSSSGISSSFDKMAIVGGRISLAIDEFGTHIQSHELGHILGFGHTSEWIGTMSVGAFPGDTDISSYSVNDVSHIQLYMDTSDLQLEESISFGVYEWRRVFSIPSLPDN